MKLGTELRIHAIGLQKYFRNHKPVAKNLRFLQPSFWGTVTRRAFCPLTIVAQKGINYKSSTTTRNDN